MITSNLALKQSIMRILFTMALLVLTASVSCKSTDKKMIGPKGEFEVQSVKKDSLLEKKMTLNFDPSTGQVNGTGVCNSYSSTYVVSGNTIKFSPAISTKMMCPEGTNLEYNFFQALHNASSYSLKRGKLTLFNAAEEPVLVAKEN